MWKILIVEDDEAVARVLARSLREAGMAVLVAHDGSRALDVLRGEGVDLVLMDMVTPDLHGLPAVQAVRALRPAVPIIVMSGSGEDAAQFDACLEAGVRGTIAKPFRLAALLQLLNETLNGAG